MRCSAAFKARVSQNQCASIGRCVAISHTGTAELWHAGFDSVICKDQKLPPSAGDFCYGKSHQNHLRQAAAAARFPARLARQAPRRTRAIPGPRTIGACSPAGLRCSAAFKARVSQNQYVSTGDCVALSARALRLCNPALLCWRLLKSKSQNQELPPSAGDFCYGKSHQNHVRRTAAATRFPARIARQAPRRTRAIHGPRTIGACSPVGLRCSAAFKARQVKTRVFLLDDAVQ